MTIKFTTYKTIGYDQNFKNILSFKIGQRKKAIEDLTNYFNKFNDFYRVSFGLLTDDEYISFSERFHAQASAQAIEFIKEVESRSNFVNNRFFAYLPN